MNPAALDELVTALSARRRAGEELLVTYQGERAEFARFNRAVVRQAGQVRQHDLAVELVRGNRHAVADLRLCGDGALDLALASGAVEGLRDRLDVVPEDPFLALHRDQSAQEHVARGVLPDSAEVLARVSAVAAEVDVVGVVAGGTTANGFASSFGQRAWHEVDTFVLDWSFHLGPDRAAASRYAGTAWDDAAFEAKVDLAHRQLAVLGRPERRLSPGEYRAYLAPAALAELVDLLGWGGFGLRAHRSYRTPLLRMVTEGATLHRSVSMSEDRRGGLQPSFGPAGHPRPERVRLIEDGVFRECLVSPRSMLEFGEPTNGADAHEAPQALHMQPGDLAAEEAAARLGTGLYVGNLWYLNWSDRAACRATGMTRFATFWAEDGEPVAPVTPVRFDDTVFRMLGDQLEGLTAETELIIDAGTYERRSTASVSLPGALLGSLRVTL